MEIAKQIIKTYKDSTYLREQTAALTNICSELGTVNRGWHLTVFQREVLNGTYRILREMADAHSRAIREVVEYENEELLAPERAQTIIISRASTLDVSGQVALVAYEFPEFQKRGQLSAIDAKEFLGEHFQRSIERITHDAVWQAHCLHLAIDVAVDERWGKFEACREAIEKKLAGRIRVYEKQIALAAKVSQAAS